MRADYTNFWLATLEWILVVLRFFAFLAIASAAPRAVLLTTDCGADIDDQWVIAHLVRSPAFDVRAIVTTHTGSHAILAAPAAESSARIAREVLQHVSPPAMPLVIAGSSVPLHTRAPLNNAGVERILAESRGFSPDHRLTIVVIGAATDTASALLADPTIADRIEIVAMGFRGSTEGGDEFNVTNDPLAWRVILDSRVPVTIGGSTVAKRDLSLTSRAAHAALDGSGDRGRYLAGLLDGWLRGQRQLVKSVMGDDAHWPVWDEVTVAYMLGMTKSEVSSRPTLRPDLSFEFPFAREVVTWITAIDAHHLWRDLATVLDESH